MSKNKKKTVKKAEPTTNKPIIIGIVAVIVILAIGIAVTFSGKGENGKDDAAEATTESGISLPYNTDSEDTNVEISSLYQFSGPNPDCNFEEAEDIATLTVTNCSEQLLEEGTITVTMKDGEQFDFKIELLPAGKTAQIFDVNNKVYTRNDDEGKEIKIEDIQSDMSFTEHENIMEDQIKIKVKENETKVKLTNTSDEDLENVVMRCHTLFDGEYFGGLTYTYEVGTIKAGEKVKIDAEDCFIGQAEVVELTQAE